MSKVENSGCPHPHSLIMSLFGGYRRRGRGRRYGGVPRYSPHLFRHGVSTVYVAPPPQPQPAEKDNADESPRVMTVVAVGALLIVAILVCYILCRRP
jgi:hypothetical protein